jgi:hypothetical protein
VGTRPVSAAVQLARADYPRHLMCRRIRVLHASPTGGISGIGSIRLPNDGAETVSLPDVGTPEARMRIAAVGNVLFVLSDAHVRISAGARSAVPRRG